MPCSYFSLHPGEVFLLSHPRCFTQSHLQCWPPHVSGLLALLVHTERRKSSNKMPNHHYLIAGILTFSSSYLMVVFICQTNVRNTIPQAQSLWHHSQLFLPHPCPPSLPSFPSGSWTAELQARHLQYRSCQSNRDIGESSQLSWILRVRL